METLVTAELTVQALQHDGRLDVTGEPVQQVVLVDLWKTIQIKENGGVERLLSAHSNKRKQWCRKIEISTFR